MQHNIEILNNSNGQPIVTIIIINSRADIKPGWVAESIQSALSQNISVEVIIIDNIGRKETIGKCWNECVKRSTTDYCFFLGDDDFLSFEACETLYRWANSNRIKKTRTVNFTTGMIAFEDGTNKRTYLARQHTGMFLTKYLLDFPFNEKLTKGVDREYIEEMLKRGDLCLYLEYVAPYYYRKHGLPSCAGDITFIEKPADYYFCTSNRIFLDSITKRFKKTVGEENIIISPHTTNEMINEAKVIWVEWANEKAVEIQNSDTKAFKILRLHAYEAFSDTIKNLDLNKFDKVIFIDNYIKDYVEKQYGKVNGAVVIPNGVEIDKYSIEPNKKRNNKIAYAGYLTRKKGIGELILLAESFPEYEFHLAGRYQEDDVADYFNHKMPKNVFVSEWKYDTAMSDFYKDKTFILNTSLRESQGMTLMEGMASGLKPIVRGWLGSEDVYPEKFIYNNIEEFRNILEGEYTPEEYRKFVVDNYSIDLIYPKLEELLLNEVKV